MVEVNDTGSVHTALSKQSQQSYEHPESSSRLIRHIDHRLQMQPFLAWPTEPKQGAARAAAKSELAASSNVDDSQSTRINLTLFVIAKRVYTKRREQEHPTWTDQKLEEETSPKSPKSPKCRKHRTNMLVLKLGSRNVDIPQHTIPKKSF